ncbi:hypothetical protein M8J75_012706 [Diaphorina citri]|nr:hypothetical protein M8J75_012706 [Diaphorina citri]
MSAQLVPMDTNWSQWMLDETEESLTMYASSVVNNNDLNSFNNMVLYDNSFKKINLRCALNFTAKCTPKISPKRRNLLLWKYFVQNEGWVEGGTPTTAPSLTVSLIRVVSMLQACPPLVLTTLSNPDKLQDKSPSQVQLAHRTLQAMPDINVRDSHAMCERTISATR